MFLESNLSNHGSVYFTKKAKDRLRENLSLPDDPYRSSWSGLNVKQIFETVEGGILYESVYKQFSGWHHWNPGYFGRSIHIDSSGVTYRSGSFQGIIVTTIGGVLALAQTAKIVDKQFGAGFDDRIGALQEAYNKWKQDTDILASDETE